MVPATTSLVGFSGEIKWPLGQITLLVKVRDDEHSTSSWMDFMVVRSTSPFNEIIGRPGLRKMKAVPSTTHEMIKFPVMGGTLTLRSSKIIPIECAMISGPEDQTPLKTRSKLCNLLQRSLDIFAWTPTDMTGVLRQIAEHKLNVRKGCPPVRQKKRGQAIERNTTINDEVSKLVTAGIIREVHYHYWLSNPVMVKKSDNRAYGVHPSSTCLHVHGDGWPRVYVKRKVLADFIMERLEEEGQDDSTKEEEPLPARWTLFKNGSSCVDGYGAGVILTDPKGIEFANALRFQFETTNNEAEYEALIAGLRKNGYMIKYLEKVKALTNTFRAFSIKQVPRSKNKKADALSKMASTSFVHLSKQVLVEELKTNGLVERANKSLGEGIKARLGKENKNWLEEISHVLWAHHTMIKSSNGDTPFSLTYGTEAVIPMEIGMPTFRTAEVNVAKNDEALEINLDLIEEKARVRGKRAIRKKKQLRGK
ncbi:reverse transcriptase domain-containing protein [Tanacetum coccineum]|uniref:Reverse transcriptase domain-containing protein n=1 Tax=Tanacetum coccineum TaxID=301880 RepID=A0ABQ4ZVG0_9ASTR